MAAKKPANLLSSEQNENKITPQPPNEIQVRETIHAPGSHRRAERHNRETPPQRATPTHPVELDPDRSAELATRTPAHCGSRFNGGPRPPEKRLRSSRAQPPERTANLHPRRRAEILDRRQRNSRPSGRSPDHPAPHAAQSRSGGRHRRHRHFLSPQSRLDVRHRRLSPLSPCGAGAPP